MTGALLGVVGSALLAGTAYLVVQRRAARARPAIPHHVDRSRQPSAHNSPASSRLPSASPLKVLHPGSPGGSPVSSPSRASSPQVLPAAPNRFVHNIPASPGSASFPRPMSPLSLAASGDNRPPALGLKHSSSATDLTLAAEGLHNNADSQSVPVSPASLAPARSVSFSSAMGQFEAGGFSECTEPTEPTPGSPRTTDFDGMAPQLQQTSRPGSPAGLKLHVATVLRATAAAASSAQPLAPAADIVLRPHSPKVLPAAAGSAAGLADGSQPSGSSKQLDLSVGLSPAVDAESPVASPRGCALLGVAACTVGNHT